MLLAAQLRREARCRAGLERPRPRIRVAFNDVAIRDRVKQAGAKWNPVGPIWRLRYDRVVAFGPNSRIVDKPPSNGGCSGVSGENLHAGAPAPPTENCSHPLLDAGILWQMTALQSNSSSTSRRAA